MDETEIHNAKSKELVKAHRVAREELLDILDKAKDEAQGDEAHLNWNKAGEALERSPGEVEERAVDLRELTDNIGSELRKRYEKSAYERAANSDVSFAEEFIASGRNLFGEQIKQPANVFEALALQENEDFQKRFADRKSYLPKDNGGIPNIAEEFSNAGIKEYFAAANTTANTISVNRPRDDSMVVMYRDPRTPIHQRLEVVRPIAGGDSYTYIKEYGAGGYESGNKKANAVAKTAEGGDYNEQEYQTGNIVVTAKKLTAFSKITDEQLADVAVARSFAQGRLNRNFTQDIEDSVINGTGSGGEWSGILTHTNVKEVTKSASIKKLDIFIDAFIHLIGTAFTFPDVLAMRPDMTGTFAKLKDADGNYIWSNAINGMPSQLFGVPLVISTHLPANTGLMLNTMDFALLDKQGLLVEWGYSADDFTKGLQTIRGSCRGNVIAWYENAAVEIKGLNVADS